MHIAIDVSPLESGHKVRGIGSYTDQLIKALKEYKSKHSYSFFTRGQKVPESADLVHYPYFDPFFLTLPLIKTKPTVVTVHDLIPIAYAKYFPKGLRGEFKWEVQKRSLMKAKRIITDSKASKNDIIKFIGYPESYIDVVYLAPPKTYQKIKSNIQLPKQYVLYVGDVNWNKNIPGLIDAYYIIQKKFTDTKLVLVGKQFLNTTINETQNINNLIHKYNLEKNVVMPGFVKDEDLPSIYRSASVYIQPSFAEGFGFPVLEAMASGCPVVCTNVSSLVEIAGPSATVSPNTRDIASGITNVLTLSKKEREDIVKKGLAWVKQFTWERTAKETVTVYEKALE